MNKIKSFLSPILPALRRFGALIRKQPFLIPALLCAVAAAALVPGLLWKLAATLNDLQLAVAKRLAGTGASDPASMRVQTLALLIRAAIVAALYLAGSFCALYTARRFKAALRDAVQSRRKAYEAEGHTPPPDWEQDAARDVDRIAALIAAAPEWMMLLAGLGVCVTLLLNAPFVSALLVPITAAAMLLTRSFLRRKERDPRLISLLLWAIWSVGLFLVLLLSVRNAESTQPLGALAALLLSAGLLPPAALQLPIRTLRPARQSYQRIRGFLKN